MRLPSSHGILVSARGGWPSEAVAAVDWAVAPGHERHGGVLAAFGANSGVHFPRASIITTTTAATTALRALRLTAGRAALGLVCVALVGVVRLVISAEGK